MSRTEQLAWAVTRLQFSGEASAELLDGGSVSLRRAGDIAKTAEQFHRVSRKHGVAPDDLVPVETTVAGKVRNHWTHRVAA